VRMLFDKNDRVDMKTGIQYERQPDGEWIPNGRVFIPEEGKPWTQWKQIAGEPSKFAAKQVAPSPAVKYSLAVYEAGTDNELQAPQTLKLGQNYELALIVQDLRPEGTWTPTWGQNAGKPQDRPRGVFAAYVKADFDAYALYPRTVNFSPTYMGGRKAALTTRGYLVLGAFGSLHPLGSFPIEVARARVTARKLGTHEIKLSVLGLQSPAYDTLVYAVPKLAGPDGEDQRIPPNSIAVGTVAVTIAP
jgi:hypothetical protein